MFKSVQIREGHDNFFTPLRLIFASMVVIGHAFVVLKGGSEFEPHIFYHYTASYLAVNMFFIASGFLVTKSMLYRGKSASFLSARLLRIYPALIIHVLFVMLIIGPFVTSLNFKDFVSHPDWYLQPLKVLSFADTDMVMPQAFTRNTEPYGSAALWTLRYEILAYLGTWLIFLIGGLSRKWMIAAQFILPSLVWVIGHHYGVFERLPATFEGLARFGIAYGLGATLYAYRGLLRFNMFFVVLFLTLCWLVKAHTPILEVAMNLALAWAVMLTAYASAPKLAWTQRLPDLSYGIYIYHWVILQSLFYFFPELTLWVLICAAYGLTLILASFSWYVIEKPSLNYKPVMTRLIEKSIGRRAEPSRG